MTAGFLCAPIMRPNHRRTILHVSILAALLLTLNADNEDSDCEVEPKVQHNTFYEVSLGQELRIKCPVGLCNDSPPTVSWYKDEKTPVLVNFSSRIEMKWETVNFSAGISYLIFNNILKSDLGSYHCKSGESVSHSIDVSLKGNVEVTDVTPKADTNSTIVDSEPEDNVWMYVYTAAGIVSFVVIVIIISVVSMQGCKGKPKKETQPDNQYMVIPMVEQPSPHASLQASPRGSPSVPPSRRSTQRKKLPPQPAELPLPRDNEHLYGKMKEDRERQRHAVEKDSSSLVYAALNHQPRAGAAAWPQRPEEESSEYAAIRVKDH